MHHTNTSTPYFDLFSTLFRKHAGMFSKSIEKMLLRHPDQWRHDFEEFLQGAFAGDTLKQISAIQGYCKFCLEGMRLQKEFNITRQYPDKSYQDALENVYMNSAYMQEVYLPGILLSNYLWPHHYQQLLFYRRNFLPLLERRNILHAYDVGTGTGFFSVQLLKGSKEINCHGLDISPSSRDFTLEQIKRFQLESRFQISNIDISQNVPAPSNCIQCIEILEHLPDPQTFLKQLRKLLARDGIGFITAALTAANADHIYLYWEPEDVIKQLTSAGFNILDQYCEQAYAPSGDDWAPRVCGFIVH